MFSHGVIAGLLFAVVGRMVYDRTHTRQLADLRAMPLHRLLPFAAVVFVLAGPRLDGHARLQRLPAELTILIGAWKNLAALGAGRRGRRAGGRGLHAAGDPGFLLRPARTSRRAPRGAHHLAPITWPEKAGALLLLGATVLIGLKPDLLLNWINPRCNRR
jgi:NADH-quinone oxidoreductase subunit M